MERISVLVVLLVQITRTASSGCPPQYTEYSGHCYKVHQQNSTFTESRRTCQNEGGDLVSINTQAESDFLVHRQSFVSGIGYWIGMEYVAGKYQWFDGRPVYYTNWGPREPNCMSDSDCVAMFSIAYTKEWEDADSNNKEYFICEVVPVITTTTVEPDIGCPPQYTKYSGHCYKIHNSSFTFTESRRTCQNEGGDLVSVNSQAEDNFLTQRKDFSTNNHYWIGMQYVMGKYQWVDGSPVTYTNWSPREPNCMNSTVVHCSAMYSVDYPRKWQDAGSNYATLFICELVPASTPNTLAPNIDFREAIHFECHHLGWYVTVDLTKLSLRPSDVTEIYMNEDTCTGTVQGDLLVFNQTYKQCNTRAQIAKGEVTFNNYLVYATSDSDNIIRDFRWKEDLHCSHDLQGFGSVNVKPNITKEGSTSGKIPGSPIDISLFTDSAFKQPLHGAVKLGTPVYVQVLSLSHPDVVMVVDSCEAEITTNSSYNQKPFPLIQNQCSVESTTNIIAVRNQVTRFKFDMFDLPHEHNGIFVTCHYVFCDPLDFSARCEQTCKSGPGANLIG